MWLETKFQPFRLRNDKDIGCRIDVHGAGMTCTPLYVRFQQPLDKKVFFKKKDAHIRHARDGICSNRAFIHRWLDKYKCHKLFCYMSNMLQII